jgi:hypothetical protein
MWMCECMCCSSTEQARGSLMLVSH